MAPSESKKILSLIGEKSTVAIVSGYYRGLDEYRAVVDFSDGRVPAYFMTDGYRPELNEPVWVQVVDGVAYMMGPTAPKPSDGVFMSQTDGIATVQTDVGSVQATFDIPAGSFTPGVSVVKLYWSGGCHILGIKSANPGGPEVPPAPGGGSRKYTRSFSAIDSGSFQPGRGWRTNDVWCSANNSGGWFYGNKIKDTIPDSAQIITAEIFLPQTKNLGVAPFGRHDSPTKPIGPLTFHATGELPGRNGWVRIPNALINHLKSNAGGLGFAGGGYSIWTGTQNNPPSGTVRVTYQT